MSRSLGSLRIDLAALTGKFDRDFKGATTTLDKFGAAATKIGKMAGGAFSKISGAVFSLKTAFVGAAAALGVAHIAGSFNEAAEAVDQLGKKAKVVGLSVEQMSVFRLAAKESGVEFETLTKLVGKAAKNISTFAVTGAGPAADEIRRLGINVRDANGNVRGMTDLLPEIASAFEGISNEGERLSIAEAIFGREGGTQFIQWLEDSGGFMANLAEQTERARRLGVLFTEDQFEKLKAYNDAIGRISEAWLGLRVNLMVRVAPALAAMANKLASVIAAVPAISERLLSAFTDTPIGREVRGYLIEFVQESWETIRTFVWDGAIQLVKSIGEYVVATAISVVQEIQSRTGGLLSSIAAGMGNPAAASAIMAMQASAGSGGFWERTQKNRESIFGPSTVSKWWDDVRTHAGAAVDAIDRAGAIGDTIKSLAVDSESLAQAVEHVHRAAGEARTSMGRFADGAKSGLKSLGEEASDFEGLGRSVTTTWVQGFSNKLSSALASGEASFKNFGKTALATLTDVTQGAIQMVLQFLIMRGILGAMGFLPAGISGTAIPDVAGPGVPTYARRGGVFGFASGGVASGVLGGPSGFAFNRKIGVAGEAGANSEVAFAPLRKIGGELGVASTGGDTVVQIIDQRSGGARPEVSESRSGDGKKLLRVVIRDEVRRGIAEGEYDRSLNGAFGLRRSGVRT